VHKYYSPALKAWIGDLGDGKHDGGPDDPRVCVIKVKALTAQYAVSKRTSVGGFVEFAKGVASGSTPDVTKLRYLDEKELEQCEWSSRVFLVCRDTNPVSKGALVTRCIPLMNLAQNGTKHHE